MSHVDLDVFTHTGGNRGKPSVFMKEVKDDKHIETIEMARELVELLVSEPKCSAWKSDYSDSPIIKRAKFEMLANKMKQQDTQNKKVQIRLTRIDVSDTFSFDQNLSMQNLQSNPKKAQNITTEKSLQRSKKKSLCLDLPSTGLSKPMKTRESKIDMKQLLSESVNPSSVRTRKRKRTWSKKSLSSPERAGLCRRNVDDVDDISWQSKEKQLSHTCQTNKKFKDSRRPNWVDNKNSCQRCMADRGEISDTVATAGSESLNQSCLPSCHESEKTGCHTESHARGKQKTRTVTNKGYVQYSNETLSDTSGKCTERGLRKKGQCRKKNSKTELKRQNIPVSQLDGSKLPFSLTRNRARSVQQFKKSATVEPKPKRKVSTKPLRCNCCDAFPLKITNARKRRKDVEVSPRLNQTIPSRLTQNKRKRRKVKLKLVSPIRYATPEEVKLANSLIFEISKDMGLLSEEYGKETCGSLESTKDSYMKQTNISSKQDMLSCGRHCSTDKEVISQSNKHLDLVDTDTEGVENENHSPSSILDTSNPNDISIISKPIPGQKSINSSTNLSKSIMKYPLQVQEIPRSSGVTKSLLRGDLQYPTYSVANEEFCDNSEPLDLSMKTTKETATNLSIPKDDPCPTANSNIIVLTKKNPSQTKQLNRIITKGNFTNLTSHPKKKVSMIITLDMLNPGLSGSKVPKPIMEQCMSKVTNSTVINSFDSGASKVCIVVNTVKIAHRTQETKGNDYDVDKGDKVFFEFIYRDPVLQENWPCLGLIEKNDLAMSVETPQVSNSNTVSRINLSSKEDYVNSSTNSSIKNSVDSEISSQQAINLSMDASDLTSAFTAKTLLCSQKTTTESSNTTSSEKLCVDSTTLFQIQQCAAIQRPAREPCQTPPSNHSEDSQFISEPIFLPTSKDTIRSVKAPVTCSQLRCHNSSLAKVSNEASLQLSSLSPAVPMSSQKALQDEKSTRSGFQQKNLPSSNYSEDSYFISEQISSPTSENSTQGDKTNINLSQPIIYPAKTLSDVSLTSSPLNLAIPMPGGKNVQDKKLTRPAFEQKNLPQINAGEQPNVASKLNQIVNNLKERLDIENTTDLFEKDEMAAQLKIKECNNCHKETGSVQKTAFQACQQMKSQAISKETGIKHWSERDVISWLLENNLNQFVPIFHMVDGGKLLHLKKIQTARPKEFFEHMNELEIDFLEVMKFSRYLRHIHE